LKYENFDFFKIDITNDKWNWMINGVDMITSIFTLQFIPINKRLSILNNIYNKLNSSGALILCEKVYQEKGLYQEIFNFAHYDFKNETFTYEEILSKQKDLRKIMYPLTSEENEEYLKLAGFKKIEPFFQSLNFKGWLVIK
jgi:tRNA (cmo5U34)-methyltransferase